MIRLIATPIRSIVRFPLFQLALVIGVILWLQAADDKSIFGQLFNALDKLSDATVHLVSEFFTIKSFTRAWIISGFMIAFVYLAGLLILATPLALPRRDRARQAVPEPAPSSAT